MKIAYDISVLGAGYNYPHIRTGVFRVIENLADGLAISKECELFFCAVESLQLLYASLDYLDYLDCNSKLQKVPFCCDKSLKLKRYLENYQRDLTLEINQKYILPYRWLLKILRKLFFSANQFIIPSHSSLIPIKDLEKVNIYHSTFYPIPKSIKKIAESFITVYDLIPILYPNFFKANKNTFVVKEVLKSIDSETWVTCISHSTKNDLCNYLPEVDPSRVKVTHLAASELFYQSHNHEENRRVKKKYNIPEAPYLLSLSTLEPRKNIDHTIRCFAKLVQQEHIKDLCLVLVGSKGWDYNKIFDEISNYQFLKDRIIVTGYVADEDLAALYSGALAFVYPSLYEGFGLPPLEAMQCGVPVITSNTSSLPEVVGDAGIMVSPKDADTLCQSMLEIYNNPSLREALTSKSLERAKHFSWKKCTQQTINAYKTALSS